MQVSFKSVLEFLEDWDRRASGPELWIYEDDEIELPDELTYDNADNLIELDHMGYVRWQGSVTQTITSPTPHPYLEDRKSFATAYADWVKLVATEEDRAKAKRAPRPGATSAASGSSELEQANARIEELEGALQRERRERELLQNDLARTQEEMKAGVFALEEIEDCWETIGMPGNMKALTLSEQITSLVRELEEANLQISQLGVPSI